MLIGKPMHYLRLTCCSLIGLLFALPAAVAQKKVRECKAFLTESGSDERRLQLHEKYDKNGNLIYSFQPELYCTKEFDYDAQNRPTRLYQMCGESFWNGTMIYAYPAPNVITVRGEEMVAGGFYLRRDTLDAKGRLAASWSSWVEHAEADDSVITHIRNTYSPKGLLLRSHTRTLVYDRRNRQKPDIQTDDFEEFEYNDRDSLTAKYVYAADNPQQKRMTYRAQFDSLTGKITESFEQPWADFGITRKEYAYDPQGRINHFKVWYLPSDDAAWMMTLEVLYRYPNERERIEIWRTYYQNAFDSEEVKTYHNDLLQRITVLDKNGQGQQLLVYEYTYYD